LKRVISALKIYAAIAKKKIELEMDDSTQAQTLIFYWK
jgi:tetratricopeptide repeat protein 21B